MSTPEKQLIVRCLSGSEEAWSEFFALHYPVTVRFIYQISPSLSQEDAQEICQEVFLTAIQNLGDFEGNSQVKTWLYRIAVNKAYDFLERRQAQKRGGKVSVFSMHGTEDSERETLEIPSGEPGPDHLLLEKESSLHVGTALGEMGLPCREIIQLRYFAGLSYEELASGLGLNIKTVSSRLSKCLDKFGKLLKSKVSGNNESPFSVQ